ncbi:MAG TPA: hypothetical protein PKY96_08210, partial [Flavobacteriales bacterium]|nr:hypothetical protein [Flavobacteriales bacterium]
MGTTGLVSVPYALRAQTASTVSGMALNDLSDVSAASPGNGQVLQWNGVAWVPANVSTGPAYTAGAGIGIAGNVISNTGDTNASDDITTGSTAGGDLGGTFNNLQIVANAVGTAELSNNAVTSAKIADGTIAAGDLSPMGALNGQVLKWNGSAWAPAADGGGTVNGTTNYMLTQMEQGRPY